MSTLSPSQIGQYARAAGFQGNGLTLAIAIAMAESSGNPAARNINTNGTTDYGLWQINTFYHPQYNAQSLLNPSYNAAAAYAISQKGTNWTPWSTYNSGAYLRYVNHAVNTLTMNLPITGNPKPWYTFVRIDNLGGVEPFGGFPKPDSNIQVPDGYPITALLPGVVTGIDKASAWGASVTIRLDTPLNSLATHTAYLHLRSDIQVNVNQHVNSGQLIAYNGGGQAAGSQKVPLGFALYAGDMYGSGPAWAYMTKGNLNGGPLDPVPLLNQAASGKLSIPIGSYSGGTPAGTSSGLTSFTTNTPIPTYTDLLAIIHQSLIETPGFYGIALALDDAEQFPGIIDLTVKKPDINILGQDTGVPTPDINGGIRSIGATITDNFLPFAIRSGLVILGILLLVGLFARVVKEPLTGLIEAAA